MASLSRHNFRLPTFLVGNGCSHIYEGWGLSHANYFFGKIDISWCNMEIYKWKWMVLGALGCMNNADFEKN